MPDLEGTVDRRAMPARFGCPWSALAKIDGSRSTLETHQLNAMPMAIARPRIAGSG